MTYRMCYQTYGFTETDDNGALCGEERLIPKDAPVVIDSRQSKTRVRVVATVNSVEVWAWVCANELEEVQ
jgi:hypothetical protein